MKKQNPAAVSFRSKIFSVNADPKTSKGVEDGYVTAILYMAPSNIGGYEACAMAKLAGCIDGCLNTAGNPVFKQAKESGRLRKKLWFFENQENFMQTMHRDLVRFVKWAKAWGLIPVVRPNGTTDIRWENVSYEYDGTEYANIMEAFPDIQFYDYTKIPNRRNLPSNYYLLWSYSAANEKYAAKMPKHLNFSFVYSGKMPETFMGRPVVNGDLNDLRFRDPNGAAVALKAKGRARKDTSGFVVWM